MATLQDSIRSLAQTLDTSKARQIESEHRLEALLESATDYAIITIGLNGRVTGWNIGAVRVLGWSQEDILQREATLLWTPEDRQSGVPEREMRRALEEGSAASDRWHMRQNGQRFWARGQLTPLRNGGLQGYLKILRDRTTERAAEDELKENEARLQTLCHAIPQLVWTCLADGSCEWIGPQWTEFTGLDVATSIGCGWLAAVHPEDDVRLREAWKATLAEGRKGRLNVDYRLRGKDGHWRWFQARATPLPVGPENAASLRWFGTSTDIQELVVARDVLARSRAVSEALVIERTAELRQAIAALQMEVEEREQAEAQLRQAQKMQAIGQLTGGIAHDFNNMLQAIGGSLENLSRQSLQGQALDSGSHLATAQKGVHRAAALTKRLLAFARRQLLQPLAIDPDELIRGMEELIRRAVGTEVRIDLYLRDGTWPVLCDPNQLESVLLNLAINARDAMPNGGVLTISTRHVNLTTADVANQDGALPGDYVEITIADSGAGMAPDVLAHAFEPFFTTKPIGQGTGLGLSQVHGFIRQSHGSIWLDSTPGIGTSVRIGLPRYWLTPDVVEPQPTDYLIGPLADQKSVLLVEDDEAVREQVIERLGQMDLRVLGAEDGPTALRILDREETIDLLVTDVGLPNGLNGRQVAEIARERWPELPVLFITGYSGDTLGQDLGVGMDVLAKPFKLEELVTRIATAVVKTSQHRPESPKQA